MSIPITPTAHAGNQAVGDPLGLPCLDVAITGSEQEGPNARGYIEVTIRYTVTNPTATDLDYLETRVYLVTPQGEVHRIESKVIGEDVDLYQSSPRTALVKIPAGASAGSQETFWLAPNVDQVRVVIDLLAYGAGERLLGPIDVPLATMTPVPLPRSGLEPVLSIVSGSLWLGDPEGEDEYPVEVRCLVQNRSPYRLPEVRLRAEVHDTFGRPLCDMDTREPVHPGSLKTLAADGSIEGHRLKGATTTLVLSGYWPLARGLIQREVTIK